MIAKGIITEEWEEVNQSKHKILQDVRNYLVNFAPNSNEEAVLYITTCGNNARGKVWRTSGGDFERAWLKVERYFQKMPQLPRWTKVEIQTTTEKIPASEGIRRFAKTKRNNYFSKGVAFKKDGSCSFLADEISGNALLTPIKTHKVGVNAAQLQLNLQNIRGYIKRRFDRIVPDVAAYFDDEWTLFDTAGVFIEDGEVIPLTRSGFGRGMRQVTKENQIPLLEKAIEKGRDFLFEQLWEDGTFTYGYYPAYDKQLPGYNSVRHFSSLYALLETIEYSTEKQMLDLEDELIKKVEKGLDWGLKNLCLSINETLYVGEKVKDGYELKLGAQAVAILALAKYEALTHYDFYHEIMVNLLEGLHSFIDENGRTTHVLREDLSTKEEFRIIYYDGEALFAIMRAYPLVNDERWLKLGECLMDRYVAQGYQRYHDHWLSYSVNELTQYLPKREYYEFGVKNAVENLNFMEKRDTAYPTFLELLCAANKMFKRIQESSLPEEFFDKEEYERLRAVTETRALHELRTGVMWPEYAMYFARPETIVHGFYARHDRTRMRIDDAEHFLSGLINYYWLLQDRDFQTGSSKQSNKSKAGGLKRADFDNFTGSFLEESVTENLWIRDFEYFAKDVSSSNCPQLGFIDLSNARIGEVVGKTANWPNRTKFLQERGQQIGLLVTEKPYEELRHTIPQFIVPNTWNFMYEVGAYLREAFPGPVVAVTGSVGKSTVRLMLEHLLQGNFSVLSNRGNHNTRLAMPLYLDKLAQNPDVAVLEVSLNALNSRDRGPQGTLIQPNIAILTSIDFAHMRGTKDLSIIAKVKSRLFEGLRPGGTAILNYDMAEEAYEIAHRVAQVQQVNLLTYSLKGDKNADLRLVQLKSFKELMEVTVEYQNRRYTYQMTMASDGMAENSLAAFLTLISLGLNPEDYLPHLLDFHSLPKVMAVHNGYLNSREVTIIDDTHNAAIPSMINGIQTFSEKIAYYSGKKILVLGQVADLGEHMVPLHQRLVPIIDASGADLLLAYGEGMKTVVEATKIPAWYFDDMNRYVQRILAEVTDQSLILLKGSVSASDYHKISERLLSLLKKEGD